jgi:hypothetical protein
MPAVHISMDTLRHSRSEETAPSPIHYGRLCLENHSAFPIFGSVTHAAQGDVPPHFSSGDCTVERSHLYACHPSSAMELFRAAYTKHD